MATCQTPHQIYMLLNMMTRRLDDNNFIIWRYQFQTVLEGQDLFGYIDGSTLSPTKYVITDDEGVTDEVSTAYKEWKKTDKAILSLLLATLSFDTMDYVVGSKTSREAWIRLNDRYNTFSRSHVMQLKTEMYTITKGMDSVEIYLQKVTRARNKLDALGVRMEDEDIVVVVLNGLPAEFNLIKAIIRGRKSPIAMQELRILLLSAERDIANRVVLNIQAFSAMKTKKIVSQRCLNGNGNRSKTGGDARRNRNNFLSSSQCQICREKDTAVRCFYRNIALPDQSSNSVLICQICDMKGHAALECNHLGTHIGVSPAVVDGGEQTVVIDEREHNMINDDGSDNSGRAVATDEREHNMINGDGSDKSGRENIGGVFVAEDISRTGSDECDSSGRDNIGGVFVAEDISRTGSDECDSSGRD